MKRLLWLICLIPGMGLSQTVKFRKYRKGEHFRYQITTESFRNGKPDAKTVSVSHHKVIKPGNQLVEEVNWLSKRSFNAEDTLNLDSIARKVEPYTLSLLRGGRLDMPPLTVPGMTGEITDLHTFYVAISPALHIQRLGPNHLSFQDSLLRGNFADGKEIIAGEDCIRVVQKLLVRDNESTIVETSFLAPPDSCLKPFLDTIGRPLFGIPNNFQMIRRAAGGKVNLFWGVEEFIITSTLDNRSGKLLHAEMINMLTLKMRVNASSDLKTYDAEIPLTIRRKIRLELIK